MKVVRSNKMSFGNRFQVFLTVCLVLQLSIGQAAPPAISQAIGVATARGSFHLDQSRVAGNGTLFDGSLIETGQATGELKLNNGARMMLDSSSRGKVYRDRLLLEQGAGQLQSGTKYAIQAANLQIETSSSAQAKVSLHGPNRITVTAFNGPVRVTNTQGILVATLAPGKAIELQPSRSLTNLKTTLSGQLAKSQGAFLLNDLTAGQTFELRGFSLDREVGHRVQVSGSINPAAKPAPGATQVLDVNQVKLYAFQTDEKIKEDTPKNPEDEDKDDSKKAAGAAGAGAAGAAAGAGTAAGTAGAVGAAAGAAAGIGATTAVVAGVVVAGVAAGVAVGVTRSDDQPISQ